MKKQEYLELLRAKVDKQVTETYYSDPDLDPMVRNSLKEDFLKGVQACTEVNQLIGILSELAFDVPAAMRFILEPLVEGLDDESFCANIPMSWDT